MTNGSGGLTSPKLLGLSSSIGRNRVGRLPIVYRTVIPWSGSLGFGRGRWASHPIAPQRQVSR